MNLLTDTEQRLTDNGKTWEDVKWIGKSDGSRSITLEAFKEQANQDYDNGYGSAQVNTNLVIVGDNWWLERGEYDGAEWWEFKTIPILQAEPTAKFKVFPTPWYEDDEDENEDDN